MTTNPYYIVSQSRVKGKAMTDYAIKRSAKAYAWLLAMWIRHLWALVEKGKL